MKAAFYTLGCKVNLYETQAIMQLFKDKNYDIVPFEEQADIYVINTCTVTNTSAAKSRKIIRRARKQNTNAVVTVMGCYAQMDSEEIKNELGANIIIGTKDRNKIVSLVEEYLSTKENINIVGSIDNIPFEDMEVSTMEGKTRAFIKIEDGCDNYCSYCIIPYTRGHVRSKPENLVLKEITNLVSKGYLEIVLTGIHTGHYGQDLGNDSFANLLRNILKIPDLKRLRISSIEITELTDEVLSIIKENNVIANHLHIPLQTGNDKILKAMNRKYDTAYFMDKINKIRNIRPDISITTDVIVGFPGETEQDFNETYKFIEKIDFSCLHVFPYSKRDNTKAALMPNQISNDVKKERVDKLIKLSRYLELKYMTKFIDKTLDVIPETIEDNSLMGHTSNYLKVKFNGTEDEIGKLIQVKINKIVYPYCLGNQIK